MAEILLNNNNIKFKDSPNLDAFGRLRVSNPHTEFENQLQYGKDNWADDSYGTWEESIIGAASSTHLPYESSVQMNVGTASGDQIIRQQHTYNRYQPGKSLLIKMTGKLVAKQNVVSRIGYFDDDNGVYFEQSGIKSTSNFKLVLRRRTGSSTLEESIVMQNSCNGDRLDNVFSESGITIDIEKPQLFFIDLEWLSIGRVRAGVIINGQYIVMHEFKNANNITAPYMGTANLPVRYELKNVAETASASSMNQICSTVISEGGFNDPIYQISVNNNSAVSVDTTIRPVLNIRPKELFNSIANTGCAVPLNISVTAATNDITWYVYLNSSISGGTSSWNSAHSTSIIEYDYTQTGTSVTIGGGLPVLSDVATTGVGNKEGSVVSDAVRTSIKLARSYFNSSEYDLLTIAAEAHAGTADVRANLLLGEYK
jgi:hypothetical protein